MPRRAARQSSRPRPRPRQPPLQRRRSDQHSTALDYMQYFRYWHWLLLRISEMLHHSRLVFWYGPALLDEERSAVLRTWTAGHLDNLTGWGSLPRSPDMHDTVCQIANLVVSAVQPPAHPSY